MKTSRPSFATLGAVFCLVGPCASRAASQDPIPLIYGVPGNVHVYIHGETSATPDPGLVKFERAVERFVDSGIHRDFIELATLELPPRQRQRARESANAVFDLLGRVNWGELLAHEVVFTERFILPVPEYALLCRVPEERIKGHLAGVRGMLEGFAEMIGAPMAEVGEVDRPGGKVLELTIADAPLQIAAGRVDDILVLSNSTQCTADALRRLRGDGAGSLHADERFRSGVSRVPEATESTVFVDFRGLFDFFADVFQLGARGETPPTLDLMQRIFRELDVLDYLVASTVSDGRTVTSTNLLQLLPSFDDSRLAALHRQQEPWRDWYRLVPATATSFAFDTGIDPVGLFDLAVALSEESFGNAPWARSVPFVRLREVATYLSGEIAWIAFPATTQDRRGMDEFVCLLRLEKTDGVADWIGRHLAGLRGFLASRGQPLELRRTDDLHELNLAAFPWIRPVVGVHDGHLVIATSPAALQQIDRVRRGEDPDIRSSERFAELGMSTDRLSAYVDYQQVEVSMNAFADCLSAVGFFMSIVPDERDTRATIKAGALVTKLAAVLRELDTSFDMSRELLPAEDPNAVLMRQVVRYR